LKLIGETIDVIDELLELGLPEREKQFILRSF